MIVQARYALAHPVYDPTRDINGGHNSWVDREVSACLTVNIGME